MSILLDVIQIINQLDSIGLFLMFWFMITLELPRYFFLFIAAAVVHLYGRRPMPGPPVALNGCKPRISIVIAGHNEAGSIRSCLRSLAEQTLKADEIIVVNDGSTDAMADVLRDLRLEGLITASISNELRCGKAAGCNLAIGYATGDIIINIDSDSSFDRDAVEQIVAPFWDSKVGAVSGNIGVRNSGISLLTAFQSIEYLISISLSKRAADMLNMVACASGAFSAFRKEALAQIGGNAAGSGEDFDMTIRLRRSGWKIRFAGDAWCMTDVPHTLIALTRQRRRWDRDTIRLRMRKFRSVLVPGSGRSWTMLTVEQLDFAVFNLILTLVFPGYLIFLFWWYGVAAALVTVAVALICVVLDMISFWIAVKVSSRHGVTRLWPYVVGYGVFNTFVMRFVRIYAYFEEWVFRASYDDRFAPKRVLDASPYY